MHDLVSIEVVSLRAECRIPKSIKWKNNFMQGTDVSIVDFTRKKTKREPYEPNWIF